MASGEVREFTIAVPEVDIDDLRARLARTRWPEAPTVSDWSQGVPVGYLREVCDFWADGYDWRRCESDLNAHPNAVAEIAGIDVHFQHIRSRHDAAMPLIITHGWPGSVVEFQKIIGPLTDPEAHGGTADDAFHLVMPSLPGFGWSGKPTTAGTGVEAVATMWDELMVRLGYDSYIAQGGDWGASVTSIMGSQDLGHCRGIHLNMPLAGPTPEAKSDPTPADVAALEALDYYLSSDSGYATIQSTRPQSIGYGLVDSPAMLAGWILEKFWSWTDRDGHPEDSFSRDQLLDNISVYWFTATGASAARLYWESFTSVRLDSVEMPTACSIFPKEILRCTRSWAEQRYLDIRYWNELDHGGHFPAFELPDLFVAELRAARSALS